VEEKNKRWGKKDGCGIGGVFGWIAVYKPEMTWRRRTEDGEEKMVAELAACVSSLIRVDAGIFSVGNTTLRKVAISGIDFLIVL
jgi:hypothetical protein